MPFGEISTKYRKAMAGLPFSKERWRRFFSKNQIFMTLCMECAYIENVRTAQVKAKEQGDMFKVLQEHAANVMGQHNEYVRQNLKKRPLPPGPQK